MFSGQPYVSMSKHVKRLRAGEIQMVAHPELQHQHSAHSIATTKAQAKLQHCIDADQKQHHMVHRVKLKSKMPAKLT